MATIMDKIYNRSPLWLQNIGIAAFGVVWKHRRLGGRFKEFVDEFSERERFAQEAWQGYQIERLRELVRVCYYETPYYHRLFKDCGIDEAAVCNFSLDDLRKLPLLEKNTIRENPEDFIADNARKKKLHKYHTSGSTGTPLIVRESSVTHQIISAAYEARCRRWAGVNHTMSRAMIGCRLVVPRPVSGPPFWRYNPAERQVYFSAFHISPENVRHYVSALNHYKADYLVGYASSHYFLARMIEEQGFTVYRPNCVLTSSEKLTDEMRRTLERVYRCEVFDGYSGVECCCLASECEHHHLHVSPDVGIIELVDDFGNHVKSGEPGEIVATGLLNFDQPLLRFRTGDIAILDEGGCTCGREMPILRELVGRMEDTIYGVDGRQSVRFHGIFVGIPSIREGQVIQETLTEFTIRVVAPNGLNDTECNEIYHKMHDRLGNVKVRIECVNAIERTARGKFKAVVCKLTAEEKKRLRKKE